MGRASTRAQREDGAGRGHRGAQRAMRAARRGLDLGDRGRAALVFCSLRHTGCGGRRVPAANAGPRGRSSEARGLLSARVGYERLRGAVGGLSRGSAGRALTPGRAPPRRPCAAAQGTALKCASPHTRC